MLKYISNQAGLNEEVKRKLTFTVVDKFTQQKKHIICYYENEKKEIFTPKYFLVHFCISSHGNDDNEKIATDKVLSTILADNITISSLNNGNNLGSCFLYHGKLRANQKQPAAQIMSELHATQGACVCLPTGFGKSFIALYIVAHLRIKPIIIVHKTFLLEQWHKLIKHLFPNATIGKIQGKEFSPGDFTLATIQTVTRGEGVKLSSELFGMVILDECHHLAADSFSKVFRNLDSVDQYRLALSSTPKRKDKLDIIVNLHCGRTLTFGEQERQVAKVRVVTYSNPSFKESTNVQGKINMALCLNKVTGDPLRNQIVAKEVCILYKEEERHILLLSDRIDQLKDLVEYCKLMKSDISIGLFIGKKKQSELQEIANSSRVIFATYGVFSEGVSVPRLNTIIFASPKSDVKQSVGRIFRKKHNLQPVILDVFDDYSVFKYQYFKRNRFYKESNFEFENCGGSGVRSTGNIARVCSKL